MRLGWWWCVEKGQGASKHIGIHQRGPWRRHEVMAGTGAHEGHVGRQQHVERGLGMLRGWGASRGMGHVLGGHRVTHHMSPSVGQFTWMWGWKIRHMVGVRT